MVICHCLAVNDKAISALVAERDVTVDDVIELCGAGGRCGGCRDSIEWVLRVARRATPSTARAVPVALPA